MEFLVRFTQAHEGFRRSELEILASLAGASIEIISYSDMSPFCVVKLPSIETVQAILDRSILINTIYELWGSAPNYESLHADLMAKTSPPWATYRHTSFRFTMDDHGHKRASTELRPLFESFAYMDFKGPIKLRDAELDIGLCEYYELKSTIPTTIHIGRCLGPSRRRKRISKFDLKKRQYLSTTSMDSELALVTANFVRAEEGKLIYDPFSGTGSFPIACAEFGAMTLGSDLDGRTIRGTKDRNVLTNFGQYGLVSKYLDGFVSDMTNTPLRVAPHLDGIVCDPPYGVREGLKVLGGRNGPVDGPVIRDGQPAHYQPGFVPPKKQYSFDALLDDILDFAATMLVVGGWLAFWMPTANDEDIELAIPTHPCLELSSVCVQPFNKWSRRLLTYQRMKDEDVDQAQLARRQKRVVEAGQSADALNSFRKRYHESFRPITSTPGGDV